MNVSRCRSCGASIVWIRTKNGRMMPCDSRPIHYVIAGMTGEKALTLVTPDGETVTNAFPDPDSGRIGYQSHFATCRFANRYKRRN